VALDNKPTAIKLSSSYISRGLNTLYLHRVKVHSLWNTYETRSFASHYFILPFKLASLIKSCKYKFIFRSALRSVIYLSQQKCLNYFEIKHASMTATRH